ncbi:hypothetical protein DERF_005067 [Dermatophagoides farinae]|uniref:Uncharacterized protein n=1 Tax=Dermatophagoides farinae TaxID=6954 RepID=A0A922I4Y3_DERFA|nr:hypothetical protein DERF_005067 [Dermatophagoides farinae]
MGTAKKTINRKTIKANRDANTDVDDDRSSIPSPAMSRVSNEEIITDDADQPMSHVEIATTSAQPQIMQNQQPTSSNSAATQQQQTTVAGFHPPAYQSGPSFSTTASQYQPTSPPSFSDCRPLSPIEPQYFVMIYLYRNHQHQSISMMKKLYEGSINFRVGNLRPTKAPTFVQEKSTNLEREYAEMWPVTEAQWKIYFTAQV